MRVAILTFAWSNNYGAALQALALQRVLRTMNCEPFVVPLNPASCCSLVRRYIGRGFHNTIRKVRMQGVRKKFDIFRCRYFDYGGCRPMNYDELIAHPPKADCYIVGSDQVWNTTVMRSDIELQAYFLEFLSDSVPRLSYAASFSVKTLDANHSARIAADLKKFKAISTREKSGVDIVGKMGLEAEWLPDPTLLMTGGEWRDVLQIERQDAAMVFHYELPWETTVSCRKAAEKIAVALGCFVESPYPYDQPGLIPKGNPFCSPTEWFAHLSSARFVVTNSFHGTVFSLLTHRPFAVVLIKGRFSGMNERILALLERVGLSERIVNSLDDAVKLCNQDIDWAMVDRFLESWRESAIAFLKRNVKTVT